jgi:hypothetical protein
MLVFEYAPCAFADSIDLLTPSLVYLLSFALFFIPGILCRFAA